MKLWWLCADNIDNRNTTYIVDADFRKWYNVCKAAVDRNITEYDKTANEICSKRTNDALVGGRVMTIYDENKSLSFNVIGYENNKEDDDYDWLMFRFEYSDGNSIE